MADKQWNVFFKSEAPKYLENGFTKNTVREVDFLIREMGLKKGQTLLDIGCGTGRHSLELARRGFRCTGIDQSQDMLEIGRSAASKEGLAVEFIRGDAAATRLTAQFDHAFCLCEGAFSLLEVGAEPVAYHRAILENIALALKPEGRFLLTALNALRMIRKYTDQDVADGAFDLMTTTENEKIELAGGTSVSVVEKGFMPSELRDLLESAGFKVLGLWGGSAGSWNKQVPSLDEMELMALAQKR